MKTVKRLLHRTVHHHHFQSDGEHKGFTSAELELRIGIHHGIPSTASYLDLDHNQGLLAIATLDGRIKVLGGDDVEGLLMSPNQFAYKNIKFLQNQGFLVAVSKQDEIQVWNLETRNLESCLQWESNITAFSVITGSYFIYIGDEHGTISVVKYDAKSAKLVRLPYHVPAASLHEAARIASCGLQPIVGILPQPCSFGNRVLIAYMNGLIILWDISEARVLFVGGGEDLKLKNGNVDPYRKVSRTPFDTCYHNLGENEITALCWASSNGSILAVGYIDGDILLWKIPPASSIGDRKYELLSNNVVKMKLSSAERRLPVVVMHWSASNSPTNECNCQLFVYGGVEMGSLEVITALTLEWSSGILRCTGRLDLILPEPFGDMTLLPNAGSRWDNEKSSLFVLTNPGKLHLYDDANLSSSSTQQKRMTSILANEYRPSVLIRNPTMTVARFVALHNSTGVVFKSSSVKKHGCNLIKAGAMKWPLTRSVPSQLALAEHTSSRRLYMTGYNDGSIRLWDATYPVLSLICVLKGEVQGIKIAGIGASITSLDFCSVTMSLAVGNECGLVFIYNFDGSIDKKSFCFVTGTEREYYNLPQVEGPKCRAVFSLLNSQICALKFSDSGAKLAVAFECGRVAVLKMDSLSVLFLREFVSTLRSSVISLIWIHDANTSSFMEWSKYSHDSIQVNHAEDFLFVLTKDANINIVDGDSGSTISSHTWHPKRKSVALSIYIVGNSLVSAEQPEEPGSYAASENESMQTSSPEWIGSYDTEHYSSIVAPARERLMDSLVLLSCEDSLCLYSTKSMIQGNNKTISKVKHAHHCFWTSTLKKHGKVCGVVLVFQNGVIEIRSFPDLKLVKESSLMEILRWKFEITKKNIISSSDDGLIMMANGSELASISLLSSENYSRMSESFPCLHDKVLAADFDPTSSVYTDQRKTQVPEILDNIIESIVGGEMDDTMDCTLTPENLSRLEKVFSRPTLSNSRATATTNREAPDIDRELRALQVELIKEKYGRTGNAYSFSTLTGEKHQDRQQQLTHLRKRTGVLQSEAESFASMANELAKKMENENKREATNRIW